MGGDEQPSVFRPGGVSYLRIPAPEPGTLAPFYRDVFGWNLRGDPAQPSFDDGSGHVIGHFMPDLAVAGEAGFRPYVYVERIDETLASALAAGGTLVTAPYPEGDLWVAVVRDLAGNLVGVWQRGPRG